MNNQKKMIVIIYKAYYPRLKKKVLIQRSLWQVNSSLSRECTNLLILKDCDYIIKLLEIFISGDKFGNFFQNLVLENNIKSLDIYMEEFRKKKKYMPIGLIKQISKQLLLGLDFCHKKNIVLRNLKPENIFLTEEKKFKIGGFNKSKLIEANKASRIDTVDLYYRAPELLLNKNDYNEKIDVFAAGCIIVELFILTPLFRGKDNAFQLLEYMSILGNPGKEYYTKFDLNDEMIDFFGEYDSGEDMDFQKLLNENSFYSNEDCKNASNLISKMLDWDINQRFSAEQCLNHDFFKEKN
jgi:serine/threonine protein kinase